tara:strand:- start:2452 stop:3045 length:594 start_codon:yes stop_codon:yes gene_type:complete
MEIDNTNLHNYIKIYDDILRKEQLNNFIRICDNRKEFNQASIVGSKENPNRIDRKIRDVQAWDLGNMGVESRTDIYWANYFCFQITNHLKKYAGEIGMDAGNESIISMQLLKYENNGHYRFHVDHGKAVPRTISCIFFVNDNYKGGELAFKFPGSSQELVIEKKSNRLIIWPSNFLYPHAVKPVTEGIRYSVVAWAL